jgi:hypothetical protein
MVVEVEEEVVVEQQEVVEVVQLSFVSNDSDFYYFHLND